MSTTSLPYRVSVLVFVQDAQGRFLLLQRRKAPNQGLWSPVGGKLDMHTGESPLECAQRELLEETGLAADLSDFHGFGYIAEKGYEGQNHWLLFLYHCLKPIPALPADFSEGSFGLFERAQIDTLPIAEADRVALWPIFDKHAQGFVAMRADCQPGKPLQLVVEQIHR